MSCRTNSTHENSLKRPMSFMGHLIFMEGVEMEEQRVSAVRSWPINSVKAVQRFLGFTRGFSTVVALLTSMPRGGPQRLHWTAEAERTFEALKASLTTAGTSRPLTSLHHRGGCLRSRSQGSAVPAHRIPSSTDYYV